MTIQAKRYAEELVHINNRNRVYVVTNQIWKNKDRIGAKIDQNSKQIYNMPDWGINI